MKSMNHHAVLEVIAQRASVSRVDVANHLGLSQTSVTRVVDALIAAGIIREGEKVTGGLGRPQTQLEVNPEAGTVAAFDLRSRTTRFGLADLHGSVITQEKFQTDANSIDEVVKQLVGAIEHATSNTPLAIVLGISGAWDANRKRIHAAPNLQGLIDSDIQTRLEEIYDATVLVDNDINFAALGEFAYGAAQNTPDFFYMNLGTGVGGANIISGNVHRGDEGFAGEVGYIPISVGTETHSLEQVISRSTIRQFVTTQGIGQDEEDLFAHFAASEPNATEYVQTLAKTIATGLCSVVCILNPKLIVLGGSIGRFSDHLIPLIQKNLTKSLPVVPPIVSTRLRDDAALLGAVSCGIELARKRLVTALLEAEKA